jgi:hypothetical protein
MLFCALTASIALSPVVRIDSQPKMLKMTSSRSGRRQMSSLASVVSSSYPFRDSFSKRSLVRRALTPREFGPVRGFEEPFADKIEVMMSMFAAAGGAGVYSGDEPTRMLKGPQNGTEVAVEVNAVDVLRRFGNRAMERNSPDAAAAFGYAQMIGSSALTLERAYLRDAVVAVAAQAESVQLGFMGVRADEGYRVRVEEWLPELGVPGPSLGSKLNAPAQICEQQSFLLYDSAIETKVVPSSSSSNDDAAGQALISLRPFGGEARGVMFMPRFEPADSAMSKGADLPWTMSFGELPIRLFYKHEERTRTTDRGGSSR